MYNRWWINFSLLLFLVHNDLLVYIWDVIINWKTRSILKVSILECKHLNKCCPRHSSSCGEATHFAYLCSIGSKHFWNASFYQSDLYSEDSQEMKSTLFYSLFMDCYSSWASEWMITFKIYQQKKQATTTAPLYRVTICLSDQVPLSFLELFPNMLRKALVVNFISSHFLKGGVNWLWGTSCISYRRWGMVIFLKTKETRNRITNIQGVLFSRERFKNVSFNEGE